MSTRLRSSLIWACVYGVLGYLLWSQMQRYQNNEEAKRTQAAETNAAVRAEVVNMAALHQAETGWAKALAGKDSFRLSQIHSVELPSLWQVDKPILFIGRTENIADSKDGMHEITATYDDISSGYTLSETRLQVAVKCPSRLVRQLQEAITKPSYLTVQADVALVARIDKIEQSETADSTGGTKKSLLGTGTCLDVRYLANGVRL